RTSVRGKTVETIRLNPSLEDFTPAPQRPATAETVRTPRTIKADYTVLETVPVRMTENVPALRTAKTVDVYRPAGGPLSDMAYIGRPRATPIGTRSIDYDAVRLGYRTPGKTIAGRYGTVSGESPIDIVPSEALASSLQRADIYLGPRTAAAINTNPRLAQAGGYGRTINTELVADLTGRGYADMIGRRIASRKIGVMDYQAGGTAQTALIPNEALASSLSRGVTADITIGGTAANPLAGINTNPRLATAGGLSPVRIVPSDAFASALPRAAQPGVYLTRSGNLKASPKAARKPAPKLSGNVRLVEAGGVFETDVPLPVARFQARTTTRMPIGTRGSYRGGGETRTDLFSGTPIKSRTMVNRMPMEQTTVQTERGAPMGTSKKADLFTSAKKAAGTSIDADYLRQVAMLTEARAKVTAKQAAKAVGTTENLPARSGTGQIRVADAATDLVSIRSGTGNVAAPSRGSSGVQGRGGSQQMTDLFRDPFAAPKGSAASPKKPAAILPGSLGRFDVGTADVAYWLDIGAGTIRRGSPPPVEVESGLDTGLVSGGMGRSSRSRRTVAEPRQAAYSDLDDQTIDEQFRGGFILPPQTTSTRGTGRRTVEPTIVDVGRDDDTLIGPFPINFPDSFVGQRQAIGTPQMPDPWDPYLPPVEPLIEPPYVPPAGFPWGDLGGGGGARRGGRAWKYKFTETFGVGGNLDFFLGGGRKRR
ncbi:MAG: hypothetical protein PHU85_19570, partial [Phycisphaerae bacterium]|nr:hypothetical protein [Phycisphaerae bacterium]